MVRPLAALFLVALPTAPAWAQEAIWNRLDVAARLGDDGRLQVAETHEIDLQGDLARIGRDFGLGVGQSFVFKGLSRIGDDGAPHPLAEGDLKKADTYAVYPAWMQWSLKDEGAPAASRGVRRYVLEYELVNALAPAWDLPNGTLALDPFHPTYRSPLAGVREAWPLWREAWPRLHRRYRLDHDVLFPNRGKEQWRLARLDYRLEWDEGHWRLLEPERDMGRATPDVDYRVQRTLEYLAPGSPAAVDLRASAFRAASIVGLPVACSLLWCLAWGVARMRRRGRPVADHAFFASTVLAEPPEIVRAWVEGGSSAPPFPSFLLRLAAERKLSIEIVKPGGEDDVPNTRLRLLSPRQSLHPYEREVLDALMGEGSEITSEEVQKLHEGGEFDTQEVLEASFRRAQPPPLKPSRPVKWLSVALLASGLALAFNDMRDPVRLSPPYAIGAGFAGGFVAGLLPLPIVLLSLANATLQIVPSVPLSPWGAAGIAVLFLAQYPGRLSWGISRSDAVGRRRDDLLLCREWAAHQLKKPRPALKDAWVPHLEALGLEKVLKDWRRRGGGAPVLGAPDLADMVDASEAMAGPPFTGNAPVAPAPEDDEWCDGFDV